jgi:phage shock protein PspC (stress-responsive transcriptional regulator)
MKRELSKSRTDSSLAGVCGGIAEFFGWSSFRVRLVFVLFLVFSGIVPGVIAYAVLCFLMPWPDDSRSAP